MFDTDVDATLPDPTLPEQVRLPWESIDANDPAYAAHAAEQVIDQIPRRRKAKAVAAKASAAKSSRKKSGSRVSTADPAVETGEAGSSPQSPASEPIFRTLPTDVELDRPDRLPTVVLDEELISHAFLSDEDAEATDDLLAEDEEPDIQVAAEAKAAPIESIVPAEPEVIQPPVAAVSPAIEEAAAPLNFQQYQFEESRPAAVDKTPSIASPVEPPSAALVAAASSPDIGDAPAPSGGAQANSDPLVLVSSESLPTSITDTSTTVVESPPYAITADAVHVQTQAESDDSLSDCATPLPLRINLAIIRRRTRPSRLRRPCRLAAKRRRAIRRKSPEI